MARTRPTASVEEWVKSVADVLPLEHLAVAPYTLGEAVSEFGAYAQAVSDEDWGKHHVKKNRDSLRTEADAQSEAIGEHLAALVTGVLLELRDDANRGVVVSVAARFTDIWCSEAAVSAAFRDLCNAAKLAGTTSSALRKRSAIIASQLGAAAHGPFSVLRDAAQALVDTEQDLTRRFGLELPRPLTQASRLEMAMNSLTNTPTGRVVVWTAYYRAVLKDMRLDAGPVTFLQADWALPNAFGPGVQEFPERDELRDIRKKVQWLDDVYDEAEKGEERFVIVRIDLGDRKLAGAASEAQRRVEALLSVAVGAGGASWQRTGATAVFLEGGPYIYSPGSYHPDVSDENDDYGMEGTADILSRVAKQLDDALTEGPMPDRLVEALTSLREARMTDHSDVLFYGGRRVTPRVATALEDHAMELFASVLHVYPFALADALQRREALRYGGRQLLKQLYSPFKEDWSRERHEGQEELKRRISKYSSTGTLFISIPAVVAAQKEIRALPMSELQRSDFDDALRICTEPTWERRFLTEMSRETKLLQSRYRRVRNAVNHGLPLDGTTLNSVRSYGEQTSNAALNLALTWFRTKEEGAVLVKRVEDEWEDRMLRIDESVSLAELDASAT